MTISDTDPEYDETKLWRKKKESDLLPYPFKNKKLYEVLAERPNHAERSGHKWTKFCTVYYNQYHKASIERTRFMDGYILERLKLTRSVERLMSNMGMGNIAKTPHELYPDLVRQFLASCHLIQKKRCKDVNEWKLGFFIDGAGYQCTVANLCDIYGFERRGPRHETLATFAGRDTFWRLIGSGAYAPSSTKQSLIRHPALRIVARLISHTLLRRTDPGRLYAPELTLLYYAVGDAFVMEEAPKANDWNMGAVFVKHLVGLRTNVFSRTKEVIKREPVGSLLTPIFRFCGVPFAGHEKFRSKTPNLLDEDALVAGHFLRLGKLYEFTKIDGSTCLFQLPNEEYTGIDTPEALRFTPPEELLRTPGAPAMLFPEAEHPTTRGRRAAPRSAPAAGFDRARYSTGDMPDLSTFMLPPQPTMEFTREQRLEYKNTRDRRNNRMLRRIVEFMFGCARPQSPPSPTHRAPTPEDGDEEMRDEEERGDEEHQSTDFEESRPTQAEFTTGTTSAIPWDVVPYVQDPFQMTHPPETYFHGSGSGSQSAFDESFDRRRSRSPRD